MGNAHFSLIFSFTLYSFCLFHHQLDESNSLQFPLHLKTEKQSRLLHRRLYLYPIGTTVPLVRLFTSSLFLSRHFLFRTLASTSIQPLASFSASKFTNFSPQGNVDFLSIASDFGFAWERSYLQCFYFSLRRLNMMQKCKM